MKTILKTILFSTLLSINLSAQTIDATLLESNFAGDSNPKNITKGITKIYFSANDGVHGRELWVYNSIVNTTSLVKDIYVNNQSGLEDSNFVTINDQLYFTANDGLNGIELWTSDGTETGTFLIKNINNNGDSSIGKLKVLNGNIFFSANDNVNGQELWISDGTTNGTILLKDINSGNNSSYPKDFFIFNNNIYFLCNNGINGIELWKSDGTSTGTVLLKDINPSTTNPSIDFGNNFIVFNNNFYFFANNGTTGFELWKSDGTTIGTQLLKDIYTGFNSSSYKMVGSSTSNYFVFGATNSSNGNELWKSDGTSTGTILLKDINSTWDGINYTSEFVTFNGKIYFTANNDLNGNELWVTDGTTIGTQIVKDIFIGNNSSDVFKLTTTSNFIIFSATDNSTNYKNLWKSNGTLIGTSQIKDIDLSQTSSTELSFVELNNLIYFQGGNNSLSGIELWKTDGTLNSTSVVCDIFHKYGSFGNRDFIEFNNKMIFAGTDGVHGIEPFITDGTITGTKMIKDLSPNNYSIYNDYDYRPSFTKAGSNVYFRGTNGLLGFELFKTDGTESGTSLVKDVAPGNTSSIGDFTLFMNLNDIVFFKANDQIHGEELWRSDGTDLGTYLLKDINPGTGNGVTSSNLFYNHYNITNENCYAILNGYLYFIGRDNLEYGIWRTDGTTNGTIKVVSLPSSGSYNYRPEIINSANGKVFFKTNINNSSYGNNSLWSTDGTQSGTVFLGSWLMSGSAHFRKNIVFNNELYFTLNTENGIALMKSDGTFNGTVMVTNPNFTNHETFNSLKSCGNFVYFTTGLSGQSVGVQLWKTDGTNIGTTLVEEIPTGGLDYFADCTCIQNNLFFLKHFNSDEVWYINDNLTTPNNYQINVLNSNDFSNNYGITDIHNFNNNLLLEGTTQLSGNELYFSNISNVLNVENFDSDNFKSSKIIMYPNPSNGKINVLIKDNSKIVDVSVYNFLGENVMKSLLPVSLDSYDLSKLNKGIYLIKITTENYSETKKIIIE
jgi:ELWxxDGT repeat protein